MTARAADLGHSASPWRVVGALATRSIVLVTRIPSAFIPSVVFPVFFVISFGGAFRGLALLPGFPTDEILNWFAPMSIMQGAGFLGVMAGMSAARDIETGFYDRLLLAPSPRWSLMVGPVIGSLVRSFPQIYVVLVVAGLGGMKLESNALGLLTLLAASLGITAMHAFWTLGLAYRFRSQRVAPLMQIGVFFSLFLASAQVPISVMTGWLHEVARVNPMSNVLRLARVGFLGDVTWHDSWGGLLALAVGTVLAALFAARQLRNLAP